MTIWLTKNSAIHFCNGLGCFLWRTETDEAESLWSASSLLGFTIFAFCNSFTGFFNLNGFIIWVDSIFGILLWPISLWVFTNRFLVIKVCDDLGWSNWAKSLECFSEWFVIDWVIQILDVQIHTYSVIRNQSSCLPNYSHNQLFTI